MSERTKRFAKYPALAEMLREMSPDGRRLVEHWHRVTTIGFGNFLERTLREMSNRGFEYNEREAVREMLGVWQRVLNEVSAIIADPRPADWCCAPGMQAWPDPCPQHG